MTHWWKKLLSMFHGLSIKHVLKAILHQQSIKIISNHATLSYDTESNHNLLDSLPIWCQHLLHHILQWHLHKTQKAEQIRVTKKMKCSWFQDVSSRRIQPNEEPIYIHLAISSYHTLSATMQLQNDSIKLFSNMWRDSKSAAVL